MSFAHWKTRDLMVIAVIGIAYGVLFSGLFYLYAVVLAGFPLGAFAFAGMGYFGAFLIAYIFRRPAAVVIGQLLGGLAALPFHPAGLAVLIGFALYGVLALIALWIGTRFRDFGLRSWVIAAIIAAVFNLLWSGLVLGAFSLTLTLNLIAAGLAVASCIGFAFLARTLADALARSGSLSDTPLNAQQAEI